MATHQVGVVRRYHFTFERENPMNAMMTAAADKGNTSRSRSRKSAKVKTAIVAPVTPQVEAIKGTAPLGIKAPASYFVKNACKSAIS